MDEIDLEEQLIKEDMAQEPILSVFDDLKESENKLSLVTEEDNVVETALLSDADVTGSIEGVEKAVLAMEESEERANEIIWLDKAAREEGVNTPVAEPIEAEVSLSEEVEKPVEQLSEDVVALSEKIDEEVNALESNIQEVEIAAPAEPEFRTEKPQDVLIWQAEKGASLRKTMKEWCEKQNVEFIWPSSLEFKLDKDVFISGTFENAVDVLFSKGLEKAPKYEIKPNPHYIFEVTG